MTGRLRIPFVYIANDVHSLIAETILRRTGGEHLTALNAGVRPTSVDPRTLSVFKHAGILIQGLSSKPLKAFAGESFDYLIDLCDEDTDKLAQLPRSTQALAWSCGDLALQEGLRGFSHVLQELDGRIRLFLAVKNRPHEERS